MIKKIVLSVGIITSLNASDIINDTDTGLMWQDSSSIVEKNWSDTKRYCKNLSLGGYDDWRLPNIDELVSITDKNRDKPAIKDIFKNTKNAWYWSSSQYKNKPSQAWVVSSYNGRVYWLNKSDVYSVRCVR
ncbi:MAG: DUF1566 domain-containing protein [Campylobacterota bacterium]|nr:DUF1566 domain-containing protein [Campylobacterota bacterium]